MLRGREEERQKMMDEVMRDRARQIEQKKARALIERQEDKQYIARIQMEQAAQVEKQEAVYRAKVRLPSSLAHTSRVARRIASLLCVAAARARACVPLHLCALSVPMPLVSPLLEPLVVRSAFCVQAVANKQHAADLLTLRDQRGLRRSKT